MIAYLTLAPVHNVWLVAAIAFWNLVDGAVTGTLLLVVGMHALHLNVASWPGLLVAVGVAAVSAAALGVLVAQISLATRDTLGTIMNVVFFMTLMLSGANLAVQRLPAVLQPIARIWPLSHAIAAARAAVTRPGIPVGLLLGELVVAAVVAIAATSLASYLELRRRRHGVLLQWG